MNPQVREMVISDYEQALELWKRCAGMGLSDADEKEPLTRFLERNPDLSFVAMDEDLLIGTCLCGTDGRRGYLYHLAIDPGYRRLGIGHLLVKRVFDRLHTMDIHKCHIMVYASNEIGLAFWKGTGWVTRPEIVLMSKNIETGGCSGDC